jgi:menaquinone-dependent protoporphyrinogen IX oxidase
MACVSLLALLAVCPAFAQPDSTASVKETPVKILIAQGESYLEKTVSSLIADSLSKTGCAVKIIALQDLNKQNRQDYSAIILFSAIKHDRINSAVNKYIKTTENYGTQSNLLICTVYGEKWQGKEPAVNAVTSATKTLKPENVAARVLSNIRMAIQEKH